MQGEQDVVVGALSGDGGDLLWARCMSGSTYDGDMLLEDEPRIVEDDNGNIVVSSTTMSSDIPTDSSSLYSTYMGELDILLASIEGDGAGCNWITYLGGVAAERGMSVALVPSNILVAGYIYSYQEHTTLPVTMDAYDDTHSGHADGYIYRLEDPEIVGLVVNSVRVLQEDGMVYISWEMDGEVDCEYLIAHAESDNISRALTVKRQGETYGVRDMQACESGGNDVEYVIKMQRHDGESVEIIREAIDVKCVERIWDIWASWDNEGGGTMFLVSPIDTRADVYVYDLRGRVVYEEREMYVSAGAGEYILGKGSAAISSMPSGVYILQCAVGDMKLSSKVCVTH